MKITIERGAFLKALNHVQSVVERRNTIPILSNVLLLAENGMLELAATDLEIEMREKIGVDIATPGATTASAHVLYDVVRKLPDGAQIELSADKAAARLTLKSSKASFSLQTLPQEDFPVMSKSEMSVNFAISGNDLRRLIDKTRFAISVEETRYYLNGIYLHTIEDQSAMSLRAVATDGHRLARVQMPCPAGADGMPDIIVPRKTVAEVQKLLEDEAGEVAVQISSTQINFAFSDIVLASKLIDGKFPDYSRVIPVDNDKILSVDTKLFATSVDRVSAITNEKSRAVKLGLTRDNLVLAVSNPEGGDARDELKVGYAAEAMDIGFNSRYLLDIIAQLDGETAKFELADSAAPTIIRCDEDQNALYVLMPMRV